MKKKIFILIFVFITTMSVLLANNNNTEADPDLVFDAFNEVFAYILNYHTDENKVEDILRGAMRGMVDSLDVYSEYLTLEQYEAMQEEYEGYFGGIGIIITPELTIVSPIRGTPGEAAGLQTDDHIIAIDGKSTEDLSQSEGVDLMRGEPGTEVTLTIRRDSLDETFEVTIIRDDIQIPYVEWEMKTEEIGYISVAQFVQNVGAEVETAIKELEAEGAKALILDLRSNPGGLLNEAIDVGSSFLNDKDIVAVRSRIGADQTYRTTSNIYTTDLPLLLMINQGSASGSEIVAGAIQDYNRGILFGKKSFGKATVQSLFPLVDGSALKLTTAQYYTPFDRNIHEKGIDVDVEVDFDPDYDGDNQLDEAIQYIKENILNNYIDIEEIAS
ncbi:S41 family peptidase [Natronospora cellulosivora (SeqCode)]